MNTRSAEKIKRIVSFILALSLIFTNTVFAQASEDELSSPETVEESLPEVYLPEKTEEASEDTLPPGEDLETGEESEVEGENTLDTEAETFAAAALLVTGTHSTYLSGYKGGYFKPESYMTRAEVSQMLYNLLGTKPAVSASQFTDVPTDHWAFTAVNALENLGIINGYSDGTFKLNKTITRGEFVTLVSKCFPLTEGSSSFSDVSANGWAYPYISSAVFSDPQYGHSSSL